MAPARGDLFLSNSAILSENGISGLPRISTRPDGGLTIQYIRRNLATNPGITYIPEVSSDLSTWTQLDVVESNVTPIDSTWDRVIEVSYYAVSPCFRLGEGQSTLTIQSGPAGQTHSRPFGTRVAGVSLGFRARLAWRRCGHRTPGSAVRARAARMVMALEVIGERQNRSCCPVRRAGSVNSSSHRQPQAG